MRSEETQRKLLESDISRIPESEGDTEIAALYKVSPSKFVLALRSKTAKEKFQGTEIQCGFGDSEICLNFRKRVDPFRNWRKPIFVTIVPPEFISDQAVSLALYNFQEVVSVFKGRHEFDRNIRNDKKYVKIFLAGRDPPILPRKFLSMVGSKKEVIYYRCKTRHMLGENCPVATPTTEDSGMPLNEQSDTPGENLAPL